MQLELILAQLDDFPKILEELNKDVIETRETSTWIDQYKGKHKILDRVDKIIGSGSDQTTVVLNKLVMTFQQKIVKSAVSFLFGEPVELMLLGEEKESFKDAFQAIKNVWFDNKLDYFNRKITKRTMIESKAAELWYVIKEEGSESQIRVMLLSEGNGDVFYPHFDSFGKMDAFIRNYKGLSETGEVIDCVNIYTKGTIYLGKKITDWVVTSEANPFGKIPVVYYDQLEPEWIGVQSEIDRAELLISQFSDTNDYFGSPSVVTKGEIENAPEKGEVGKVFQIKGDLNVQTGETTYNGGINYLTWDRGPESIKIEWDILKDIIYSMTDTPDLSFSNVKGVSNLSGIALKFMFWASILKAKDNEELFGESMVRRINVLRAIISVVQTNLKAKMELIKINIEFSQSLPENQAELIETLSLARGGEKIISEKTALQQNPLVVDAEQEKIELDKENETNTSSLAGTFDA